VETRQAFGFSIHSELPLPDLAPAEVSHADVQVHLGKTPSELAGAVVAGQRSQATPDEFLLAVPDVARFMVRGGKEIVVEVMPGASPGAVRTFLLGTALGALCYQRGLLPLHANAVAIEGRCVAIGGPSGAGKSTLGAHLARRGHDLVADDVCAVRFDAGGAAWVQPGVRQHKLWSDALTRLGHDTAGLERVVGDRDKYVLPSKRPASDKPIRLERLYLLSKPGAGDGGFRQLGGVTALRALIANTYRFEIGAAMGLRTAIHAQAITLLRQAALYRFRRRWGFDAIDDEVLALERHVQAAVSEPAA
jgi:hypothetical protein